MSATKAKAGAPTLDSDEVPMRPLGRCGRVLGGGTPSKGNAEFWNGMIPWITAKEMWTDEIRDSKLKITEAALKASPVKLIPANSVLFVVRGSILFKRVPVAVNRIVCTINQDMKAIVPNEDILPEYLAVMMRATNGELKSRVGIAGNSAGKLETDEWSSVEIPIPPLPEQRRLVARIESLTSRLEQARQARQAALAEAEHMLAAAISSLLERRKPKTVALQSLLSEQPRNGWSPPAIYQTGDGIPVLTLSAVTGFSYDGSKVKLTSAPTKDGAHYWLQRDELLITRSNTPELVGHAAIYDGTPARAICCDLIMKMKVSPAKADVRFVHYCLRSPAARQFITQRAKGASGTMQKIAKQDVQEIPIPEIPVTEQRRIVARLDVLAAKQTELRRLQTETEADLAAFTPGLLAKTFRGEL